MRLTCPNCATQYEVDASAIPSTGRDVQCGTCDTTWFQPPASAAEPQEADTRAPAPPPPAPQGEPDAPPPNDQVIAEPAPEELINADTPRDPTPPPGPAPVPEAAPPAIDDPQDEPADDLTDPELAMAAVEAWAIRNAETSEGQRLADQTDPQTVRTAAVTNDPAPEPAPTIAPDPAPMPDVATDPEPAPEPAYTPDATPPLPEPEPEPEPYQEQEQLTEPEPDPETENDATASLLGQQKLEDFRPDPDGVLARRLKERVARAARERTPEATAMDPGPVQAATSAAVAAAGAQAVDALPVITDTDRPRTPRPRRMDDIRPRTQMIAPTPEPKRGAFLSGFMWVLLLVAILVLVYLLRPQISAAVPAVAPYLDAYGGAIDNLRQTIQSLISGG